MKILLMGLAVVIGVSLQTQTVLGAPETNVEKFQRLVAELNTRFSALQQQESDLLDEIDDFPDITGHMYEIQIQQKLDDASDLISNGFRARGRAAGHILQAGIARAAGDWPLAFSKLDAASAALDEAALSYGSAQFCIDEAWALYYGLSGP